ncbi:MAG: hypothetical protein ACJ0KI_05795 [Dehalococcoidia bacterium]
MSRSGVGVLGRDSMSNGGRVSLGNDTQFSTDNVVTTNMNAILIRSI